MKIYNNKGLKRTKLHVKDCVVCGEKFGTFRNTVKLCSRKCQITYISEHKKTGEIRICFSCNKSFYAKKSEDRRGCVRKYCSQKCRYKNKKLGLPNGEYLGYDGYIIVNKTPDGRKQIKKHRLIMETNIGRKLRPEEIVHHKDGNKLNNKIENLEIMSISEHNRLHAVMRRETNGKARPTGETSPTPKIASA